MSLGELTTGQLIDGVYAALLGKLEWSKFLGGLRRPGHRDSAVMLFLDPAVGSSAWSVSSGLETADIFLYNSYYTKRNPWMAKAAVRPIGLGVTADDMLPREQLARTEFYNDYMRRIGCESAVGMTMFRDGGCSFMLSMLSETSDMDVLKPLARRFTHLAPHLREAFRHYRRQSEQRAQLAIDESLFASRDTAVIVFGEGRLIHAMSDAAAELAEQGHLCGFSTSGAFEFRSAKVNEVVAHMLRRDYRGRKSVRLDLAVAVVTLVCMEKDRTARFFEGPSVVAIIEPKLHAPARLGR
jgi:hypothetical protein